MKSRTVPSFWRLFRDLPPDIQMRAYRAYRLWRVGPFASILRFKRVSESEQIYSVRIGRGYRALGLLEGGVVFWYFIGNHDDYERKLRDL